MIQIEDNLSKIKKANEDATDKDFEDDDVVIGNLTASQLRMFELKNVDKESNHDVEPYMYFLNATAK